MAEFTPSAQYRHDLESRIPFPTKDAEWEYLQTTDIDVRNIVVERNLRFARWLSYHYQRRLQQQFPELHIPYDDILGAAHEGMVMARDRFDISKSNSAKFITYAVYSMAAKICEEASRYAGFTLPKHALYKAHELIELVRKYERMFQKPEDADRMAKKEGRATTILTNTLKHEAVDISTLEDELKDNADLDEEVERNERRAAIEQWLQCMWPREAKIIRLHYGLGTGPQDTDYGKEFTLEEIGGMLNISRTRVGQIIDKRISKLRRLEQNQPTLLTRRLHALHG